MHCYPEQLYHWVMFPLSNTPCVWVQAGAANGKVVERGGAVSPHVPKL